MKYQNFIMKLLALTAICGVLYYYQTVAQARAAVVAENEAAIAEVEAYNKEIKAENARILAAASGDASGEELDEASLIYKNGTYEGEGTGYGGPIRVSVTIEQDEITDVQVLSHDGEDPAYYMLAEGLTDVIVQAQSLDIDAASGATFSSHGILEAVQKALEEAENV